MSEEHKHDQRFQYTVTFRRIHWWQKEQTLTIMGVGSTVKGAELLIFEEGGNFHSINYGLVKRMEAVVMPAQGGH